MDNLFIILIISSFAFIINYIIILKNNIKTLNKDIELRDLKFNKLCVNLIYNIENINNKPKLIRKLIIINKTNDYILNKNKHGFITYLEDKLYIKNDLC